MAQPEKLGPYRIVGKLGEGAMGVVYKGLNEEQGQDVAVKVLMPAVARQRGFRIRFEAEIESLRKLQHPNIVRLYGFGEEDGQLYYGMEYVEGAAMDDLILDGRRFHWREVIEIGKQVCKALKHAHDRGVIHRDLKPANLILSNDGVVKLADFGIAKLYGNTGMTVAGGTIGTASYMAPEQAEGGRINERADLYALGGVFYALLAGRPPLTARTLPEMIRRLANDTPDSIRLHVPDVPPELDVVIANLLQKDPKDRVANAAVLARSLAAVEDAVALREKAEAETDGTAVPPPKPPTMLSPRTDEQQASAAASATPKIAPDEETLDLSGKPHARTSADPDAPTRAEPAGPDADTRELANKPAAGDDPDATLATRTSLGGGDGDKTIRVDTPSAVGADDDATIRLSSPDKPIDNVRTIGVESPGGKPDKPKKKRKALEIDATAETTRNTASPPSSGVSRGSSRVGGTPFQSEKPAGDDAETPKIEYGSLRLGEKGKGDEVGGTTVYVSAEAAAEHDAEVAEEEARSRPRIISLGALVVLLGLAGIAALIWYVTRPPTADDLYDQITSLQQSGLDDDLRAAGDLIEDFERLYGGDARLREFDAIREEAELAKLERQARNRAKLLGARGDESAVERAYFDAVKVGESDPDMGVAHLEALLVLFVEDEAMSDDQREKTQTYRQLAERKITKLRAEIVQYRAAQIKLATRRLAEAEELFESDPDRCRDICKSVVLLYDGRFQTDSIVGRARDLLARLDAAGDDQLSSTRE